VARIVGTIVEARPVFALGVGKEMLVAAQVGSLTRSFAKLCQQTNL